MKKKTLLMTENLEKAYTTCIDEMSVYNAVFICKQTVIYQKEKVSWDCCWLFYNLHCRRRNGIDGPHQIHELPLLVMSTTSRNQVTG